MPVLEFLNPRRVAAKKLARVIAERQHGGPLPEAEGRHMEPGVPGQPFDSLERLLEEELGKYGIELR